MAGRIPLRRRTAQPVLATLIKLLLRVRQAGKATLPWRGPGIVYYNHIHWLDPVLIVGTIGRYAVPLTKIEASRWPVVGLLLKWYHVIFIRRGEIDRDALKATWDVLRDGDISVISPEGTRSLDGGLQSAKEGLAFIAQRSPDCWLSPCAVTGTPEFSFSFGKILKRPIITLTYGRPFRICWPEGRASREQLREMTDEAMVQLAQLLPEAMRGDYAGRDPTVTKWLEFQ